MRIPEVEAGQRALRPFWNKQYPMWSWLWCNFLHENLPDLNRN